MSATRAYTRAMPKKTIRRVASAVSAAVRDAELARRTAHEPQFHRDVQQDRRGTLSRYKTVQHALRDRAASEKADKGAKAVKPGKTRMDPAAEKKASRKARPK